MAGRRVASAGIEWTPANVVTMVRICLIPIFFFLLVAPWAPSLMDEGAAASVQPITAMIVFALISLTDSLDGYLARSRNEITVFGKFMDPIADKVLVISALVALVELGSMPSWVPIVIIARELLVSGLRMLVASAGVVVAANWIGKAKTFTTMVAICMFIIMDCPILAAAQPWFTVVSWIVMTGAVVLTVISMIDYFAKSWPLLNDGGSSRKADRGNETASPMPSGPSAAPSSSSESPDLPRVSLAYPDASPLPVDDMPVEPSSLEGRHTLARSALMAAHKRGLTLGTAESCTSGLVAAALTSVPGSSETVAGGVVSYMSRIKSSVLGVPDQTIDACGVVSSETAQAMAAGARAALEVDFAVSTTGIAGPGGGTEDVPVGTVWFGIAGPNGTSAVRAVFSGNREQVRAQAVDSALALLIDAIEESENS